MEDYKFTFSWLDFSGILTVCAISIKEAYSILKISLVAFLDSIYGKQVRGFILEWINKITI